MNQSEEPSENKNKKENENLDNQQVEIIKPVKFQAPKKINPGSTISKNILSGFSKMLLGFQVPDYSKMLLDLQVPDYSTMLLGLQVPDCSKMLLGFQVPDYSKMLLGFQVPDYSKMLLDLQVPDYSTMLLGLQVPDCSTILAGLQVPNYRNALRVLSVEEIETLSLNSEDPRQIFPNLTPNLEKVEYLGELDSEVQNNYEMGDFEINSKAYKFLCNLETYLRHLIKKRILEPYERNLESKIPQDVLIRCEERKRQDTKSEYDLIDYSDFTDLKKIFEKGKNKNLFKDLFNDEEYRALITKLHEIDPIRKKIAHFRPLTIKEFNRLVLYHDDIFTIVKYRQP